MAVCGSNGSILNHMGSFPSAFNKGLPDRALYCEYSYCLELSRFHTRTVRWVPKGQPTLGRRQRTRRRATRSRRRRARGGWAGWPWPTPASSAAPPTRRAAPQGPAPRVRCSPPCPSAARNPAPHARVRQLVDDESRRTRVVTGPRAKTSRVGGGWSTRVRMALVF